MERWGPSLNTQAALRESQLVAFVRVTGNSVLLIDNDGKHFRPEYDGSLSIGMSPQLEARLRWKPTEDQPWFFSLGIPSPEATES
jgi:hypothetical protein